MKIEKIASNKVKITITIEDLNNWDLSLENIAQNTPRARDMLYEIMRMAEDETGFQAENGKVMVEIMPTSEGITMFATRLEDLEPAPRRKPRYRVKKSLTDSVMYSVCFASFEDLLAFCKNTAPLPDAAVYALEDVYYLLAASRPAGAEEYGTVSEVDSLSQTYFEEHGTLIFTDAFAQIQEFFA